MQNNKVINYIKECTTKGFSKDLIYKALLNAGHSLGDIEACFGEIEKEDSRGELQGKTVRIILIVGAILVGAGIFSFIAANWQNMDKFTKIFAIFVSMITCNLAGWYFKEKTQNIKTGYALIFLGTIIFGAGIFLVAQIFHTRGNWPDGFILWMIGSLAMAYALNSPLFYYFSIILGIIATSSYPWLLFSELSSADNPFFLTSTFLLVITTAILFYAGFSMRRKINSPLKDMC